MKQLFITFLFSLFSISKLCAETVLIDGVYYYLMPWDATAMVVSGEEKPTGDIVIPPYISIGYKVVAISSNAFKDCTGITSIVIPSTVNEIGKAAFAGCSNMISVIIPYSVEEIESGAFADCNQATMYINCENEDAFLSYISDYKCYRFRCGISNYAILVDGKEIKDLVIPNSVLVIEDEAFRGCNGLKSVTLPNTLHMIGGSAFSGCTGLTSVTLPNTVEYINSCAFMGCTGLTSLTIPNSVLSIGDGAFKDCIYEA